MSWRRVSVAHGTPCFILRACAQWPSTMVDAIVRLRQGRLSSSSLLLEANRLTLKNSTRPSAQTTHSRGQNDEKATRWAWRPAAGSWCSRRPSYPPWSRSSRARTPSPPRSYRTGYPVVHLSQALELQITVPRWHALDSASLGLACPAPRRGVGALYRAPVSSRRRRPRSLPASCTLRLRVAPAAAAASCAKVQ